MSVGPIISGRFSGKEFYRSFGIQGIPNTDTEHAYLTTLPNTATERSYRTPLAKDDTEKTITNAQHGNRTLTCTDQTPIPKTATEDLHRKKRHKKNNTGHKYRIAHRYLRTTESNTDTGRLTHTPNSDIGHRYRTKIPNGNNERRYRPQTPYTRHRTPSTDTKPAHRYRTQKPKTELPPAETFPEPPGAYMPPPPPPPTPPPPPAVLLVLTKGLGMPTGRVGGGGAAVGSSPHSRDSCRAKAASLSLQGKSTSDTYYGGP